MAAEIYTTQELLSRFGLVAESSVIRRANKEGWLFQVKASRGGGKEWLFSSMPQQTQIAIRIAEERQLIKLATQDISAVCTFTSAPMHLLPSKDILDTKRRSKALIKSDLVRLYLEWQKKHGATIVQKKAFIDAYHGGAWPNLRKELGEQVSWKSLERWKLKQREADSSLALVDKRGIAHKGRSNLTEQHRIIILGHVLNPNAPAIGACSRHIQKRCVAENLHVPSDATIRRFVKQYTSACFDEWTLWREGKKAWNDKCAISLLRDWNLVEVGDIVIADGHTLNFETIDPETGKGKRMTLLLFYDGASNHPLGWEIMPTENTACISSAFRRTCLVLGKYPRIIYIDNGKAFRAKFFKGTSDFQQAGFLGLYADLGCEVIHAWPYHGQSKPIERFFGTFHDMEVFMPSYTGNSIARKPARMMRGENLHRKLYDKMGGRPLTLEETHTAIATWFCEYVQRPQHRTHLNGKTPAQVFQAGIGSGVDAERLNLLMLQKEIRTINKDGIRHMGRLFWHEALVSRRHSVLIRYDDQLSPFTVLVYTTDGEFICEARDREHFKIASGLHPAARILGTPEQQQDLSEAIALKRDQENLAGSNMRHMLTVAVLPESQRQQAVIASNAVKQPLSLPTKTSPMSSAEIAQIEAAKEKVRANFDTKNNETPYTVSSLIRFKDELARYDYLFKIIHEKNVELAPQDNTWMQVFEKTTEYQRNYKRRYDMKLQLLAFQQRQVS